MKRFLHSSRIRGLLINVGMAVVALAVIAGLRLVGTSPANADPAEKVCICHATGLEPSLHFVTVCASYNAIFGNAGHFNESGTPNAGHEHDYLGPCEEPDPTPEPTPEPSPDTN